MSRVRSWWNQLGGKLGITLCLAGFVALFLGWNGAASYDRVPAQFPYLVSGGLVGLSLCVIGAAMMIVETNRRGRDELLATLAELRTALETSSPGGPTLVELTLPGAVVAGASSYHRPDCRLAQGREEAHLVTTEAAEAEGLAPCRICKP